jgi:hypothetical protein
MKNTAKKPAISLPNIWVRKLFGPLGVRGFRAMDYLEHMRRTWMPRNLAPMRRALANIGTVFRDGAVKTYYPTDMILNSVSNPYNNRYVLVQQSPAGATLPATQNPSWTVSSDYMCQVVPSASFVTPGARVPLGFMTDTPGYSESGNYVSSLPYGGTVQLLAMGARSTAYAIADSAIVAGTLLVPSAATNGFLGPLGAVAGIYWCVGVAGSTSEGAGTGIELYQALFPMGVDVIT